MATSLPQFFFHPTADVLFKYLSLQRGPDSINNIKKTVCLDENHFNQNKLFFIFTLILFYKNNWFHEICRWIWNINKRKKYFLNSICTPPGLFDILQSLYSWAFPRFFKLLEFANKILSLYFLVLVLWFYLVLYVFN